MINIAINGLGRIGRVLLRQILKSKKFKVVAVNDINPDIENVAYLIKYDSTYGRFPYEIICKKKELEINKKKTQYSSKKNIYKINYKNKNIDVLIDSSGVEENINLAERLIKEKLPDAKVKIDDLRGDGDHYAAYVVSEAFVGKTRVQQHQMIYDSLQGRMGGELHALALHTSSSDDVN